MPSHKEYVQYILEQCGPETAARAMMGEYILYFRDRVCGGVYDNRLLIKPVESAKALLPDAPMELPYAGAKPMLFIENVDDGAFLSRLLESIYPQLPPPRKKK